MTAFNVSPVLLLIVIEALAPATGCGAHSPRLPPCPLQGYTIEECQVFDETTNQTRTQKQCKQIPIKSAYERWEFWLGMGLLVGIIGGCVLVWRCGRHTKCYENMKNDIRHEKNRVCARWCVKHCCQCQACVKCCEPYTRPTAAEIRAQRGEEIDTRIAYHERHVPYVSASERPHEHHHLHLDRRHSGCVHPEDEPAKHKPAHKKHENPEGKTLDEVCTTGIILA